MPLPKISATLNNCLLHALTPELIGIIHGIAETDHPPTPEYALLKHRFAEFYRIPSAALTWQAFSLLLKEYHALDVQILLGPVLRRLMKDIMSYSANEEKILNVALNIESATTLQSNGRYESLSPDEVFVFLAEPLGLNITYHRENQTNELHSEDGIVSLATIHLYHDGGIQGAQAGGHWERTPTEADRIHYDTDPQSKLFAYTPLLLSDNQYTTQITLLLLQKHIQYTLTAISGEDMSANFQNLLLTLAQIEKFNCNILHVPGALAVQLLGPITPFMQYYLEHMPSFPSHAYDFNLIQLIEQNLPEARRYAPVKTSPLYSPAHYKVALMLLTPPVAAVHPTQMNVHAPESRTLRVDEVSALNSAKDGYGKTDIEYILFTTGLSDALYETCNRPEIAQNLSEPIITLLSEDPDFAVKAGPVLKARAEALQPHLEPSPVLDIRIAPTTPVPQASYAIPYETIKIQLDTLQKSLIQLEKYRTNSPVLDQSFTDLYAKIVFLKRQLTQENQHIQHANKTRHLMRSLKEVNTIIASIQPSAFEGKGGVEGEERTQTQHLLDTVIFTVQQALNYFVSIFTKKQQNRSLAEFLCNRPFFFQRPQSNEESTIIAGHLLALAQTRNALLNILHVDKAQQLASLKT